MREIRFRFWHKEWKKWLLGCAVTEDGLVWDLTTDKQIKNVIPLEFTGLKDKNGKEIYEGDLVKVNKWNAEVVFKNRYIDGDDMLAGYEVLGWWLDTEAENSLSDVHSFCEVIGNIYENPELLK